MSLFRDELAPMLKGSTKEFEHNYMLIRVVFDYSGRFAIDVCDLETKEIITHTSTPSLKEAVAFLERL